MNGVLYAAAGSDPAQLVEAAREFSPRIDVCGPREITLDLSGLSRLFGDARTIAGELRRTAADRGLQVRVAIAGSRTAARLLVRHRAGLTIVEPGDDAAVLAPLPLELLLHVRRGGPSTSAKAAADKSGPPDTDADDIDADICASFRRWGLRTLGEVAALPPADVAARLGQAGVQWQRLARGEDPAPLVPAVPEERFEQALDLEWPIEGLEPLSFVLGRLMDPLAAHLERRDRGAAVLHVRLHLVSKSVHERSLELPVPMRDARTLRTLLLLDLESHPPPAAIDRVVVAVDPTPARVLQYSLLTRPLPSPEQVSTLMARLTALMGEGRCGAPSHCRFMAARGFQHGAICACRWRRSGQRRRSGQSGRRLPNQVVRSRRWSWRCGGIAMRCPHACWWKTAAPCASRRSDAASMAAASKRLLAPGARRANGGPRQGQVGQAGGRKTTRPGIATNGM